MQKIPDDEFCNNEAETKRMKNFDGNDSFPLLYKLDSIVFSLPVSIAFVERVFSLVSAQWTDEKNRPYDGYKLKYIWITFAVN